MPGVALAAAMLIAAVAIFGPLPVLPLLREGSEAAVLVTLPHFGSGQGANKATKAPAPFSVPKGVFIIYQVFCGIFDWAVSEKLEEMFLWTILDKYKIVKEFTFLKWKMRLN